MIEVTGNLWNPETYKMRVTGHQEFDPSNVQYLCVTTNGFVKNNKRAVMGRGCAFEATQLYPDIDLTLGRFIQTFGNTVGLIEKEKTPKIISFPVKPVYSRNINDVMPGYQKNFSNKTDSYSFPGWMCKAELGIIERSTIQLLSLISILEIPSNTIVVLPRPGVGNGRLKWEEVKPILQKHFEGMDNLFVISPHE